MLLAGILVYVLLQLAIGVAVSRRIRTEDDYLLAGRSLGYGLAIFSIFATWFGAETCIGAAGEVYERGLAGARADPFGYTICLLVMGLVFARVLWRRKLTTLADLFRVRYSPGVERLAALIMIPTSVLWAAAQVRAFGQVLSASSGLAVELTITVAAGVIILYTVSGGLLADAVTDLIQGCVLALGLIILAVAVVMGLGGPAVAWSAVDPARLHFTEPDAGWLATMEAWALPICGSLVAQELIARILASRSPQVARRSTFAAASIYLFLGLLPVGIALVAAGSVPEGTEPDQVLAVLALGHLPNWLYILFAGALVSAILSTVDSALLVCGSLLSHNIILPLAGRDLGEVWKVRFARGGVLFFGLLAYVLALYATGVFDLVEQASAFGSSGLLVIMVFGLAGRFGGPASAYGALLAGVGTLLWAQYYAEIEWPYLASLAGALVGYLVPAFAAPWVRCCLTWSSTALNAGSFRRGE